MDFDGFRSDFFGRLGREIFSHRRLFDKRQTCVSQPRRVVHQQTGGLQLRGHSCQIELHGLKLASVGVKDVILPGEMKTILNQVVEAEKVAQANLIRRREETAATRSLLNTARLMEENPTLLRLKELETLEKVTEKVGSLTVYDGLEGVLKNMVPRLS